MIETVLLALAVFHATLLAVVAILAVLAGPRPNPTSAAMSALANRFLIAYCRAYVPRTPDNEEQVDLTRWISGCC